ncbi:hypothetical protein HP439_18655 [Sphingobacterium shayense]|uniref:hypothetical protein n=1 Tax=Sphingobacterium shayense TaxID=626343 RepID=UPI00155412A9|nr:hypothetical protein [Sphingobacterium shayense]NQD72748.1 hypothetical protein [Sphingobacterium shayense]
MENFLPALLIIGGVIYKIYSEYKKEQEKARKRIPSRPSKNMTQPVKMETTPPIPKTLSVPIPTEKTRLQKYVSETFQAEGPKRNSKAIPKKLEVEVVPDPVHKFDLRQAVIQSAILDRPYK